MQRLRNLLRSSADEIAALRAYVTGKGMKLRQVERQFAGARGRAMRKEKMALKKFVEINQST